MLHILCGNNVLVLCATYALVVITFQVLLFRWYVTILVEFIMYLVRPFYGATNDITITYNDSYPRDVMLGNVHAQRILVHTTAKVV